MIPFRIAVIRDLRARKIVYRIHEIRRIVFVEFFDHRNIVGNRHDVLDQIFLAEESNKWIYRSLAQTDHGNEFPFQIAVERAFERTGIFADMNVHLLVYRQDRGSGAFRLRRRRRNFGKRRGFEYERRLDLQTAAQRSDVHITFVRLTRRNRLLLRTGIDSDPDDGARYDGSRHKSSDSFHNRISLLIRFRPLA